MCKFYKGWFAETLATNPVNKPIRMVFIDCDLAKGTFEVLKGVVPNLVKDGSIYSQDYHIRSVRELLNDQSTWNKLQRPFPKILKKCGNMASFQFVGE